MILKTNIKYDSTILETKVLKVKTFGKQDLSLHLTQHLLKKSSHLYRLTLQFNSIILETVCEHAAVLELMVNVHSG